MTPAIGAKGAGDGSWVGKSANAQGEGPESRLPRYDCLTMFDKALLLHLAKGGQLKAMDGRSAGAVKSRMMAVRRIMRVDTNVRAVVVALREGIVEWKNV